MRRLLLLALVGAAPLAAQTPHPPPPAPDPCGEIMIPSGPEIEPELLGGLQELQAHVVYPPSAAADSVAGTVYVQFVVETDGTTSDHHVQRSPDRRLSAEALRVIREHVRFTPASCRGQPVPIRFVLPIRFLLEAATTPR